MTNQLFCFDDNKALFQALLDSNQFTKGEFIHQYHPDQESYIRVLSDVSGKKIVILASLNQPDDKVLPLLFFAKTARELGAKEIILLAPYLAYMRQDKRFNPGESISANIFADLLSTYFDRVVTVDPHLHRIKNLNEIFSCEAISLHADLPLKDWIKVNIQQALIIGPDSESEQWVSEVANDLGAPYVVASKQRFSDRKVEVKLPDLSQYQNHHAVIVDDIISTANSMIKTVKALQEANISTISCLGVHAIFAEHAYASLIATGIKHLVTCNTIAHSSNGISIADLLLSAVG